jgi:serine protease Do
VHFTGSLNPGMSGGPTMDRQGQVVGINVATAGNQVSFLVPVSRLQTLVSDYRARGMAIENMQLRIGEQLMAEQQEKFSSLFAHNWQAISLGEAQVLDELAPFVKCWGGSNSSDDKAQFLSADRSCRSEDNIYMTSTFATGILEYQFIWLEANQLNSWQFYNYYERLFGDFAPGNRAGEENVTRFQCDHGFTRQFGGRQNKNVFCLRAYKDYPKLYDILFLQGSVDDKENALISHFTLAGVSKENGLAFTRKFMEVSQWQ